MRYYTVIVFVLVASACPAKRTGETKTATETPTATNDATRETTATQTQGATVEPPPPDGKELYGQVCVTCHGKTGDGRGLDQQLFSFGAPAEEWKNGATTAGILKTLDEGVHATSMQPFPNYGQAEREAIASYVLELRTKLLAQK